MKTKIALQLFQRGRGGVCDDKFGAEIFSQPAHQRFRGKFGPAFVGRPHRDEDGMLEGRKITALPELQFLLEITGEIVMARELDRRAERRVGLDEYFARRFAASGPARHLGEE